jgi:serine/threonine protein kinase
VIGETIGGRYRIDSEIGVGGMGCVYRAHTLGAPPRHVAIKMLRPQVADIESYGQRFAAEVKVTSSLVHPNIVGVDDHGTLADGRQYLVLELLVGQSLAEVMERCDYLKWDRALRIARECAMALDVVHSHSVVHRDLKPENIFLQPVKGREQVKLMDFGLAKQLREENYDPELGGMDLTEPGFAIGTPTYMAPERVTGDYDCRSDLYALCVVLYEMVAGKPPFAGDPEEVLRKHMVRDPLPVRQVNSRGRIPQQVEQLLQKGLAKNVDLRYQSARELVEELSLALAGEHDPTVAMSRAPNWDWRRRFRHWISANLARPVVRRSLLAASITSVLVAFVSLGSGGENATYSEDVGRIVTERARAAEEGDEASNKIDESSFPESAQQEIAAARRSWSERGISIEEFALLRNSQNIPCGRGRSGNVSLMLCVYENDDAAARARDHAMGVLDAKTSLVMASGASLLLISDGDQGPESQQAQGLVDAFLARGNE